MSEQHKAPFRRAPQDRPPGHQAREEDGPGAAVARVIPHGAGLRAGELSEVDLDRDLEAARELAEARRTLLAEIGKRIIGQATWSSTCSSRCSPAATACSSACPAWPRRCSSRRWPTSLDLSFNRIQFTPDLMPSDITGTDVLEEDRATGRRAFRFIKGPVFANIVLADEINRTPPKTQAALLQSMQEYRVTAGGTTYALPLPFLVFATQNPIEQEGTYPLPEAQLDRFMFQVDVGYPTEDEEVGIVSQTTAAYRPDARAGALARADPRAAGAGAARAGRRPRGPVRGGALPRHPRPSAPEPRPAVQSQRSTSRGAPGRARRSTWCSAAKARAILDGRFAVVDRGRRGARPAGARAPGGAQLPRRGRGRDGPVHGRPRRSSRSQSG